LIGYDVDLSMDKINSDTRREQFGKIQRVKQMKVHTVFVIGKRDMDADVVRFIAGWKVCHAANGG
jgi:hypothetical protein